jgi:hypothetical protein
MRAIFISLGVIAVIGGIVAGSYAIKYATADVRGSVAANELVRADGQFRVAAYDRFFDLCTSIQQDEARIDSLNKQLATADSSVEVNRIKATIPAVQSTRDGKIAQYNNDAQKVGTIGPFRSAGLPERLDVTQGRTQCAI